MEIVSRHLGAGVVDRGRDALHRLVADQVPDVRDHPGRARLDEQVVVELGKVVADYCHLLLQEHQQGLQRTPRGLRDEGVELGLLVGRERRRQRLEQTQLGFLGRGQQLLRWPPAAPSRSR